MDPVWAVLSSPMSEDEYVPSNLLQTCTVAHSSQCLNACSPENMPQNCKESTRKKDIGLLNWNFSL